MAYSYVKSLIGGIAQATYQNPADSALMPQTILVDVNGNPLGVAGNPATVGGTTAQVSGSITRPANTTAYAAGEVIGTASTDVITIANAARANGLSGLITDVVLIDQGGEAAAATLELYLFNAAPAALADQAAVAFTAADLGNLVGVVAFGASYVTNTGATTTGSRVYPVTGVNVAFKCTGSSTSLYGVLVVRGAYTPVSGEAYTLALKVAQD